MSSVLELYAICALLSLVAMPPVIALAKAAGAISRPGGRNANVCELPRLGGVAIFTALVVGVGLAALQDRGVATELATHARLLAGALAGCVILLIIGIIDDARGTRPTTKLFAQVVAALTAYGCGLSIQSSPLPFVGELQSGPLALAATVLWIVGITNAVNMIDGLDGLAGGIVMAAASSMLVMGVVVDASLMTYGAASILGAVSGFMVFNLNPSRIIMGDSGSHLVGFLLAVLPLSHVNHAHAIPLLAAGMALTLPVLDMILAIGRRLARRRSVLLADRGHLHHRLVDSGLTHRAAVAHLWGASLVFAGCALGWLLGGYVVAAVSLVVACGDVAMVLWIAGYFGALGRRRLTSSWRSDVTVRP
jgi:UDP-GlcNAc:undecaprenyl-phosphate GlcNAc-1-phosphate transferase